MQKKKCYLDIEQNLTIVLIKTDSNTTTRIGHNNQNLVLTYAELFKTSNGNRQAFTGKDQKCAFCGKEHKYGKRVHFENFNFIAPSPNKTKVFLGEVFEVKGCAHGPYKMKPTHGTSDLRTSPSNIKAA